MRDIEINSKILTKLKESAEDDNEFQFLKNVLLCCASYSDQPIPKSIERELSIILENYFTYQSEV